MDPKIATAVQVRAAFREALAPEVYEEIDGIEVVYNLLNDSVDFTIKRKRDGMQVLLPLMRQWLETAEVPSTVRALQKDQQMFASLILFLA